MSDRCPVCNAALDDAPRARALAAVASVHLPPQRRIIAEALARRMPMQVAAAVLTDIVWGNDSDGGPLASTEVLRTQISHLRRELKRGGIAIDKGETGAGWCMRMVESSDKSEAA